MSKFSFEPKKTKKIYFCIADLASNTLQKWSKQKIKALKTNSTSYFFQIRPYLDDRAETNKYFR